ncbi:hypothetical protein L226DRAFT_575476 [Lentinus tigrinus ALCF2SS1-7]|uniref:Uncharacterized protein n=1 Tax=Lentinus tigrinus ALCF2SS1-6 TaxID=1328759 RepID=A0A5C2RR96_9APHY|nr:hypothetical protein L227DRAFT_617313 [Lentinus tigrinus ALCF2SS1-6]RPD69654.1 hypothetical protein L226DRAFT_575476 [Lentinus tigrinus ALCF2SS1-7]
MAGFFPLSADISETETDISRDITLLTALLKDVRRGKSTVLKAKKAGRFSHADLWSNISYVLSTGSNDDSHVVVTGQIEPESITVASPFKWTLLDIAQLREQLGDMNSVSDVDLEVHICHVMSIMASTMRLRPDETRNQMVLTSRLFDLTIMRGYRKLFVRLQSGGTLWMQHPLQALLEFYETQSTIAAQGSSSSAGPQESSSLSAVHLPAPVRTPQWSVAHLSPLSVMLPQRWLYKSLLDSHGIIPNEPSATDEVRYTVSSTTAVAWARALHACYTTMLETLSQKGKKGCEARRPNDRLERVSLRSAMALLDDAICTGIVEFLFQIPLIFELDIQYTVVLNQRNKRRLAVDDLRGNTEDGLSHILRHLGSLIIPFRAAAHIVYSCAVTPPNMALKAYAVAVTPDKDLAISTEYFDRFKEKFTALDGVKGAAVKLTASIHAEATLMSLASGGLRGCDVSVAGMPTPLAHATTHLGQSVVLFH